MNGPVKSTAVVVECNSAHGGDEVLGRFVSRVMSCEDANHVIALRAENDADIVARFPQESGFVRDDPADGDKFGQPVAQMLVF